MGRDKRIAYVVPDPRLARRFLRGQLRFLRERGWDICLIASDTGGLQEFAAEEGVATVMVTIERRPSLTRDLRAVIKLVRAFRRYRPTIINVSTPKASILGAVAGWGYRRARIVFVQRTIRSDTLTGPLGMIVRLLERLTSKLADVVVPISESQRNRSVELGLYPRERSRLLGPGSSNGIPIEAIANARAPAVDGLERACFVIGVVGRLARDKGLEDLPEVLDEMESRCPNLRVLIVGEVDVTDPPNEAVRRFILRDPRVIYVGGVDEPYGYYHLFDVLLHLSRREGFGNVILEAAAAGIPTVAYRIPGVLDAVEHGRTGLLATPLDRRGIVAGLTQYASDRSLRVQHGIAAQARARRFSQAKVWHSLDKLYADLLNIADKGEPDTLGNTRRAHLAH